MNCTQRTKAMALTLGDELDSAAGGRDDVLLHLLGLQTPVRGRSSGCSKSSGGTSGRSEGSHPERKGASGLITEGGGEGPGVRGCRPPPFLRPAWPPAAFLHACPPPRLPA